MKKMFSFRIENELYDYLNEISKENYMSITGYLTNLINKDKENKKLMKDMDQMNYMKTYDFNVSLPGNIGKIDIENQIEYLKNKIIENAK